MDLNKTVFTIKASRDSVDATRDALIEARGLLDHTNASDYAKLQRLFEAGFSSSAERVSETARDAIFDQAFEREDTILSAFNEYAALMGLLESILNSENTNFVRPSSSLANEVAEANNPVSMVYSVLRKNKNLSDKQMVTVLEAAFPIATNGLDEATRDHIFRLASERAMTPVEVANEYVELVELVTVIRFMEDAED